MINPKSLEQCHLFFNKLRQKGLDKKISGNIHILESNLDYEIADLNIKCSTRKVYQPIWNIAKEVISNLSNLKVMTVITKNAFNVSEDRKVDPLLTGMTGFMRVMNLEFSKVRCLNIDIDLSGPKTGEFLAKEILHDTGDDIVSYRKSVRYIPMLKNLNNITQVNNKLLLNPVHNREKLNSNEGTILITGGAGGIGWEIAKMLAEKTNDTIILVGRTGYGESIKKKLMEIPNSIEKIKYYSADVSDFEELGKLFVIMKEKHPQLKGVIHAAGVTSDQLIKNEEWENIEKVLNPKVFGAWNLHHLTSNMKLEYFVLFSSVTSLLGGVGVSGYSTGNSFLEGLTNYRLQKNLPCLCIEWGPWEEVGMMMNLHSVALDIWKNDGFQSLTIKNGLKIFNILNMNQGTVSVLPVNWKKWISKYPKGKIPGFLSEIIIEKDDFTIDSEELLDKGKIEAGSSISVVYNSVYMKIKNLLNKVLQKNLTDEEFDVYTFQELGIDSFMSVEFRNLINETLHSDISISVLYSYPDLKSLCQYLCSNFHQYDSEILLNDKDIKEPEKIEEKNNSIIQNQNIKEKIKIIIGLILEKDLSDQEYEIFSFQELGIDSFMSVEFRDYLNKTFNLDFSISILYSYPDLTSLYQYINNKINNEILVNNVIYKDNIEEVNKDEDINKLRMELDQKISKYCN